MPLSPLAHLKLVAIAEMSHPRLRTCITLLSAAFPLLIPAERIDRHGLVSRYNPIRTASSTSTPMQVGNGHFAFGADISGLQTFFPFAIMSDWGWKNDSLPSGVTESDIESYRGEVWDRVQYEFGGPPLVEQWLEANPNRVNLGRVGLLFLGEDGKVMDVTEDALEGKNQVLDLWMGTITSTFRWEGEVVEVQTVVAQSSDTVGITVTSKLLQDGRLGIFLDFPWNDGTAGFVAPFVGTFNATDKHTTTWRAGNNFGRNVDAVISHTMVANTFFTYVGGGDDFRITRDSPDSHRYTIGPSQRKNTFAVAIAYAPGRVHAIPTASDIERESRQEWEKFWSEHGAIDVVSGSTDTGADELQRRIILSQYLLRVNEAGNTPPQEVSGWCDTRFKTDIEHLRQSGLVNNGWVSAGVMRRHEVADRSIPVWQIPHGDGVLA